MASATDPFVMSAYTRMRRTSSAMAEMPLEQALAHPLHGRVLRAFAAALRYRRTHDAANRARPAPFDPKAAAARNDS
jgi:hypothetical protein